MKRDNLLFDLRDLREWLMQNKARFGHSTLTGFIQYIIIQFKNKHGKL